MTTPTGMISLARLCRIAPEALHPLSPTPAPDVSIDGVHISELPDPTPYLHGGELLLTTGLSLPTTGSGCSAYVRKLAGARIAGLALGLGPVHGSVPATLVRACERHGLPLLVVPQSAPFQAVTKAFWSVVGEEQERELHRALDSYRRLIGAASAGAPTTVVLAVLARAVDGWAAVADLRGGITTTSPGRRKLSGSWLPREVERLRPAGPRAAATFPVEQEVGALHPIVSGDVVVAYLLTVSPQPVRLHDRGLLLAALALLGMDATYRRANLRAERAARGVLALLIDQGYSPVALRVALEMGIECPPARVRVVAVGGPTATALDVLAETLPDHAASLWGTSSETGAWALLHARLPEPELEFVEAALAHQGATHSVVVGPVVDVSDVKPIRVRLEGRAASLPPGRAASWRQDARLPFVTQDWAREVLAPLFRDEATQALIPTVEAFLRHRGNWERTAEELGLHRNSVRSRVARAEKELGADLSDPDVVARVWLALRSVRAGASRDG